MLRRSPEKTFESIAFAAAAATHSSSEHHLCAPLDGLLIENIRPTVDGRDDLGRGAVQEQHLHAGASSAALAVGVHHAIQVRLMAATPSNGASRSRKIV